MLKAQGITQRPYKQPAMLRGAPSAPANDKKM